MPHVSKETATGGGDFGVVIDHTGELDGYTVDLVTVVEGHDMTPILASLPDGMCHCPHWGYLFKGGMTVRYADHEETISAGDAYYMSPGHVPTIETGSELVQFSPTEQLAETNAAIMRWMQDRQPA